MATSDSNQLPPRVKDERGKVYNKLTVIEFVGVRGNHRAYWLCRCECGNTIETAGSTLRGEHSGSCGCTNATIGRRSHSPEHRIWAAMKTRCYNPKSANYKFYGDRGVVICDRWRKSFLAFLEDMGPKPFPDASIDRYPNQNGPYCKENCRWATKSEQSQNSRKARMLTFNGETMCLTAWARKLGITHSALRLRIEHGWPLEKIFSEEHYMHRPQVKRPRNPPLH